MQKKNSNAASMGAPLHCRAALDAAFLHLRELYPIKHISSLARASDRQRHCSEIGYIKEQPPLGCHPVSEQLP